MNSPTVASHTIDAKIRAQQRIEEFKAAVKRPWPKWIRNLLTHLCKAYFPTIDAKGAVQLLEKVCRIRENAFKLPELEQFQTSRFLGHLCALLDFLRERAETLPLEERQPLLEMFALQPEVQTYSLVQSFIDRESFQNRVLFFKEFSHAYVNTFTPLGELRGRTDATQIYTRILFWSIRWLATRPPRSVAELHKWILADKPRPKLSPLDELRRKDREAAELKRLQQILERLGLRFRPQRKSPRKNGSKSRLPLSRPQG